MWPSEVKATVAPRRCGRVWGLGRALRRAALRSAPLRGTSRMCGNATSPRTAALLRRLLSLNPIPALRAFRRHRRACRNACRVTIRSVRRRARLRARRTRIAKSFVHLHAHTTFSFGDGACRIPELVAAGGVKPIVEPRDAIGFVVPA